MILRLVSSTSAKRVNTSISDDEFIAINGNTLFAKVTNIPRSMSGWYIIDNGNYEVDYLKEIEYLKDKKLKLIKEEFERKLNTGYFYSNVLSANVNVGYNHMKNIEGLIDYMNKNGLTSMNFRVYDNTIVTATLTQLQDLVQEYIEYALNLYQQKMEY